MIRDNCFDASRVFTVPTGIDLGRFDPSGVKPAFQKRAFNWDGRSFEKLERYGIS